jgi:phosphate ABC transporter phosphate-binding protein
MRRDPALACCLLAAGLAGCAREERLNGGGSSFVYPVMLDWTRAYERDRHVQVDYQSTGSGNGVQQMTVRTIDFGCTDAPMTAEQRRKAEELAGPVVHVPLVMGGVVPVYNVPGVDPGRRLRFSGPVLADIFLGDVTSWDDPALRELNPDIELPATKILVVARSDPSGSTAIFADYLKKVSREKWERRQMPTGTSVSWPVGEAQKGNEGVAGLVRRVPGAIGYVELKYAKDVGLEYGSVRNRAGAFVTASPASVKAAAAALETIPEDLCFSLTDAAGSASYPISGTTWAVLYQNQPPGRGGPLVEFLRWATDPSGGQKLAERLEYAPLPERLIGPVRKKLDAVRCPE